MLTSKNSFWRVDSIYKSNTKVPWIFSTFLNYVGRHYQIVYVRNSLYFKKVHFVLLFSNILQQTGTLFYFILIQKKKI